MDLKVVRSLLTSELQASLASLAVVAPIVSKSRTLRDICRLFQGVGICRLLVDADRAKFRENLVRSAQTRRYHLRHARAESAMDDRFLGLSRVESVFDAIVADAPDLAREIVALSPASWNPAQEYEDDHCYYLFVHRTLVEPGFHGPEALALLARFDAALEGQRSSRLALCRAFAQHDAAAMRDALEGFLAQRKSALDEQRANLTEYSDDALFWPGSFVSIEALAWLRLCDAHGLSQDDEFLFCPRAARRVDTAAFEVEDLLESLDEALASPDG